MTDDHLKNDYFPIGAIELFVLTSWKRVVLDELAEDHMTNEYFRTGSHSGIVAHIVEEGYT